MTKGLFMQTGDKPENMDINQFLKEAFVMKEFCHLNVMSLHGVCLDAGDMPLVVLPYMKHGDLLSYLQEERHVRLFIFQLREYLCNITHDIFFYLPQIFLEQKMITSGIFGT